MARIKTIIRISTPLSPIIWVVSSGEYTFVSMASNCIQIVHHGQLSKMITSLTKSITGYYGAGVTYDGVSNCVVTNGRPGSLQFYNLATDHCVAAVDVTKQNVIIATGSMSNASNVTKERFKITKNFQMQHVIFVIYNRLK